MNRARKRMTDLAQACGDEKKSRYKPARLTDPEVKPMTLQNYNEPTLIINMSLTSKRIPVVPFESSEN